MADRIQPRRDTAARWAAANPVLLEGEWGVVIDHPAYYKIGDGVTAWNDLPLRGYDGTLVQTTGDGTQTVMSQKATTEAISATEQRIGEEIGELRQEAEDFKQEVADNYAKQNGEYKELTAGFAYDIVGDGQATEEQFSFRPTAGVNRNVKTDGAAQIKTLKGNSVVWNQNAKPLLRENWLFGSRMSFDFQNTEAIGTYNTAGLGYIYSDNLELTAPLYFISLTINCAKPCEVKLGTYSKQIVAGTHNTGERTYSIVTNPPSSTSANVLYGITPDSTWVIGDTVVFKNVICIDLTQMFGAGNEPATVEEFYERLPKGVDLDAYNEGEIINGNYGAIKTTGVNQYNGTFAKVIGGLTYYLGGTYTSAGFTTTEGGATEVISIPSDKLYTPTQNGYIYAQGSDICISLVWPEYGEFTGYEPYKPCVRDLSWVNNYFPATINGETQYGMRSAGTARDEFRFNSITQKWEAVQRVGVVDLGSLTWELNPSVNSLFYTKNLPNKAGINLLCPLYTTVDNITNLNAMEDGTIKTHNSTSGFIYIKDSAYTDVATFKAAMAGVMLNYELAEPIVTEITENVNFAFDVSNRGTEELIAAEGVQSAPIVADIVYQPNVLATIKNVPDLAAQVAALQAQMASMAAAMATTNATEEE